MAFLTEIEIFDCLATSLRLAAEHCDQLAKRPVSGPAYLALRDELALIEGACTQAAQWRGDVRWLDIGRHMPAAHRLAGEWLRGELQADGTRRKIPEGQLHPMFVKLAEFLRFGLEQAERVRTMKTGVFGDVLAPIPRQSRRAGRAAWQPERKTASGIIIPEGVAA